MPTEAELTRLTRFSLGTGQRSLRELADEGVLIRNQGSGTFVARRIEPIDAPLHLRFLGKAGEPEILPLFPKVLSRTITREQGRWTALLGDGESEIVRIDRKLSVNGEFTVFTREGVLSGTLGRLFALAEAYPDLKANTTMLSLMEALTSTENKVAFARQAYNDAVMTYNTQREVFHSNLVSSTFAFAPAELFIVEDPAHREPQNVAFTA